MYYWVYKNSFTIYTGSTKGLDVQKTLSGSAVEYRLSGNVIIERVTHATVKKREGKQKVWVYKNTATQCEGYINNGLITNPVFNQDNDEILSGLYQGNLIEKITMVTLWDRESRLTSVNNNASSMNFPVSPKNTDSNLQNQSLPTVPNSMNSANNNASSMNFPVSPKNTDNNLQNQSLPTVPNNMDSVNNNASSMNFPVSPKNTDNNLQNQSLPTVPNSMDMDMDMDMDITQPLNETSMMSIDAANELIQSDEMFYSYATNFFQPAQITTQNTPTPVNNTTTQRENLAKLKKLHGEFIQFIQFIQQEMSVVNNALNCFKPDSATTELKINEHIQQLEYLTRLQDIKQYCETCTDPRDEEFSTTLCELIVNIKDVVTGTDERVTLIKEWFTYFYIQFTALQNFSYSNHNRMNNLV